MALTWALARGSPVGIQLAQANDHISPRTLLISLALATFAAASVLPRASPVDNFPSESPLPPLITVVQLLTTLLGS